MTNAIIQKITLKKVFSRQDNELIIEIINKHEQVVLDLFTKDEIMKGFELTINHYLESFAKISKESTNSKN